jgi:uncharacterized MnhB-related membrane protein
VDTLIFALLLALSLLVVFSRRRWLILTTWAFSAVVVLGFFAYHATDVLEISL